MYNATKTPKADIKRPRAFITLLSLPHTAIGFIKGAVNKREQYQ
jgi:hypothetical protein